MSKVDDAIVEIDQALADIAPKHEGLRDFFTLNLKPDTKDDVQQAIAAYDRRVQLLQKSKAVLASLVADGHPTLTIPDVTLSVLRDLEENAATIEAALAQFHSSPAMALGLTASPPEPK